MTATKGVALAVTLAVAGALAHAAATGSSTAPTARLKTISSRLDSKGASLVIDVSEPVPYLTTRPDPLTVVLEFRNVDAQSVVKKVAADAKSPISDVTVDNGDALGAPTSRVRIALVQAVPHRVRSEKNQVIVEFDRPNAKAAPYVLPPDAKTVPAVQGVPASGIGTVDPISALNLQTLTPSKPGGQQTASAAPRAAAVTQNAAQNAAAAPQATQAQATQAPAAQAPAAQAPAAPAAGQAPQPTNPERRYTGNPISLDFVDADLKTVLRAFAQETGLNLIIDPGVTGSVNVQLTAVPWDQALDQILRANKLGYIVDGTIVRIAPIATLAAEADDRRKLADAQANEGELRMLTKTLSYAKAEDMAPLLTKSGALSPRGTVQIDPRTNTVIVTDLDAHLSSATDLITILDKPQPQVDIEARIVQVNKNYSRALGVQWGFQGNVSPALGNTTGLAFPNSGSVTGATGVTQGAAQTGSVVNLPVAGATSGIGLSLGSVNGSFNLDVALTALETSGNGRVLSTPRVSTLNNVEAEMTQGVQIPLQTIANNTVTVTFKDAALTLKVTPQITAANTVIMHVSLENSTPDFARAAGPSAIPPIDTQRAITTLLVNDGQTTVIGGVFSSTQQTQRDGTPGLSQIPLFSWLFKRDRVDDTSSELLIFITPHILKG